MRLSRCAALAALLAAACAPKIDDYRDRRCDDTHGCLQGDTCVNGFCAASADAGPWVWRLKPNPMPTACKDHRATLLPDGRVLVTGGLVPGRRLPMAALYDSATGEWSSVADMAVPRATHVAVLLVDGTVVVAGGDSGANGASIELYAPDAGAGFVVVDRLPFSLLGSAAVGLADGGVLIVGGFNAGTSDSVTASWRYLPQSRRLVDAGPMQQKRSGHALALLPGGKVLVAGFDDANASEVYDPDSDAWGSPHMMTGREEFVLAPVDGGFIAAGGYSVSADSILDVCEAYRLSSASWGPCTKLPRARSTYGMVPLEGRVMLIGGTGERPVDGGHERGPLDTTQIYVTDRDTWEPGPSLNEARSAFATVVLPSGHALVFGGEGLDGGLLDSVEELGP